MSRYTGSVNRKSRRLGFSILETGKEFAKGKKRTYAPGQHGNKRTKLTNYGKQLQEKQKLSLVYGLTERKMRNTFKVAKKMKGVLGESLLQALESRMDNLIYRASFAATRRAARQLVTHGHVLLNGRKMDVCSHICKVGDVLTIKASKHTNPAILASMKNGVVAPFVSLDSNHFSVTYTRLPDRKELNQEINETLIVEWFNRLV